MPTRQESFAHAIRAAMDDPETGMTVKDLAVLLGESTRTISRWRSGKGVPDALQIQPMADALSVDPMLFVDPPEPPEYPLDAYRVDRDARLAEVASGAAERELRESGRGAAAEGPPSEGEPDEPLQTPARRG